MTAEHLNTRVPVLALPCPDSGYPCPYSLGSHEKLLESPEPHSTERNNFSKGARWSPDGSVIVAVNNDQVLRLFNVPKESLTAPATTPLVPDVSVTEGGALVDVCFFPHFSEDPASRCLLTSSHGHPLHLRDECGELRNTYRPFNNVEEVCHATTMTFSSDGRKIAAGFPQHIRLFDVQRPGRQIEDWTLSTRKGRGQKGIIGALEATPFWPGLYAAGSYNKSICLYNEQTRGRSIASFHDGQGRDQMGGVTQLVWASEFVLLSGHRRDGWIRAWDMRMTSEPHVDGRPRALMHRFQRSAQTHQRFLFSVHGDVLASGDDRGDLSFHSLSYMCQTGRIKAHGRPCVSGMLNPVNDTLILTSSGSRSFLNYDVDSDEEGVCAKRPKLGSECHEEMGMMDNSMRVWRLKWHVCE